MEIIMIQKQKNISIKFTELNPRGSYRKDNCHILSPFKENLSIICKGSYSPTAKQISEYIGFFHIGVNFNRF